MTAAPDPAAALWRLLLWASPAFPVGSFAHSHGLEWAIEAGDVRDSATLRDWVEDALTFGTGRTDAILLAHAHRAAAARDTARLAELAAVAAALAPARERRLETLGQGRAFAAALAAWPEVASALDSLDRDALAYPVAFGAACGAAGVALPEALLAYLQAFAGMLVWAAVRAVPLGQTDGLGVLAVIAPLAAQVAAEAQSAPLDAVGGAAWRLDIAAMRHETQYTRLFRS